MKSPIKKLLLFSVLFTGSYHLCAQKRPINIERLENQYTQSPSLSTALSYAEALDQAGKYQQSIKPWEYLAKANTKYLPQLWNAYCLSYEWNKLSRSLEEYQHKTSTDGPLQASAKLFEKREKQLRKMQETSQWIEVIDTLLLPLRDAFRHVSQRIPSLVLSEEVLPQFSSEDPLLSVAFRTEKGDRLLFISKDENHCSFLSEAIVTQDRIEGVHHSFAEDNLKEISSPFLKSDGIYLIFSAIEYPSVGKRDLYLVQKNEDGEYLKPTLLGMPFNSPANDYLLAYDELCHTGFLISDRFAPKGFAHIYTFVWTDEFRSIPEEKEHLRRSFAQLSPFQVTQEAGKDYSKYGNCREITSNNIGFLEYDFEPIQITPTVQYKYDSDFLSEEARLIYLQYSLLKKDLNEREKALFQLRKEYRSSDREVRESISSEIIEREKAIMKDRDLLKEWIKNIRQIEAVERNRKGI